MIHGSDSAYVARIQHGPLNPATVMANARLIAEAPELLAVLKEMLDITHLQSKGTDMASARAIGAAIFARAGAAIAKAEGGAR